MNNSTKYQLTVDITRLKTNSYNLNIGFMSIGIIANILCIYVFLQKKLRERKFNSYLLVLTIFELIFCLLIFADYLFFKVYKQSILLHSYTEFLSLAFDFIIHTIDSFISILTLLLSIDRLYAIKKPMKIKFFITHSTILSGNFV